MYDPKEDDDEVVELEWADESVPNDDEGEELACAEEWLDIDEDEDFSDTDENEEEEREDTEVEQVTRDGFERRRVFLPQPERARSSPDLPRVKASAFKRFIA